ncbi:hydroxypyruvate isomerase [Paenalcaligenes niemegkensis]|uniref:hydroxypyruvate isomerase n=1 Tax=Paenalcaligenes niemegkensis TaxID=2895469 RepID=UPI001EE9ADF3|nr:hydroxypyruvate isomerase [Paenalcaligenes niemegkensis]MCQ9617254.1 hydroxypyruvate isomerase [Paenalcaligenes niemegkensis]
MPKFAANLTMLFNEVDFLERFQAAADTGFKGVEYLFPYDFDKNTLAELLQKHGLTQVLHNLPAGDWAGGERGIACLPDRIDEFQQGVEQAIEYATALECKQVNCLAGIRPDGVDDDKLQQVFVDNLRFAANKLKDADIRLLVEPINTFDIPGFYLNRTEQAAALLDEVGSDNLYIQYDIYHAQRMEGELANTIKKHLPRIAHIQVADNPGRAEPGSGEINYEWLFRHIDNAGYDGWIGCEYKPAAATRDGLGWIKALSS